MLQICNLRGKCASLLNVDGQVEYKYQTVSPKTRLPPGRSSFDGMMLLLGIFLAPLAVAAAQSSCVSAW
jgi:hypothetical protein